MLVVRTIKSFQFLNKVFLLLLFFQYPLFSEDIFQIALNKNLQKSNIWQGLLHLDKSQKPSINNQKFLYSYPNFSPKKELIQNIQQILENQNQFACQFPARYLFLATELNLNTEINISNCKGLELYFKNTDMKDLELVFVSEDVSSPSSMMGHTFFKIIGKNNKTHGVSFFTEINTFNIPLLVVQSLFTGMKGFFGLSPYRKQLNMYIENRNIWEYKLNLSKYYKTLIYYHFWELKDKDIEYLFTGFNCGTIINDMFSITSSTYRNNQNLWITPKDVIKNLKKNNLIVSSKLIPSKIWKMKMFIDALGINKVNYLVKHLKQKITFSTDKKIANLEKRFLLFYIGSLYSEKKISYKIAVELYQKFQNIEIFDTDLDISKYKNPINSHNDSQLSFTVSDKNFVQIEFLPASNTIFDDNREYFSETSLKLGKVAFKIDKDKLSLESLDLLSMKSLVPWDSLTKNISKEFHLNYEQHFDENLKEFGAFNLSFGLGGTKKLGNDIYLFSLFHGGISHHSQNISPYYYPEFGFMIYELWHMKTVFNYKYIVNVDYSYSDFDIVHSIFIKKGFRIGFNYNLKLNSNLHRESFNFSLNFYL